MKTLTLTIAALAALSTAAIAAPASPPKAASGSSMSMAAMEANLKSKTGDSFDKTFLSEMIAHHQGAISMAKLALVHAKHQQIKDEAKKIISSQAKEMAEMQKWQKEWGYVKP